MIFNHFRSAASCLSCSFLLDQCVHVCMWSYVSIAVLHIGHLSDGVFLGKNLYCCSLTACHLKFLLAIVTYCCGFICRTAWPWLSQSISFMVLSSHLNFSIIFSLQGFLCLWPRIWSFSFPMMTCPFIFRYAPVSSGMSGLFFCCLVVVVMNFPALLSQSMFMRAASEGLIGCPSFVWCGLVS